MRYLTEGEIKNVICDYVNNPSYPHAIMLNGGWGIGKTYFAKQYLLENDKDESSSNGLTKRPVYLSLYSMKEPEDFWERIYAKLLDIKIGGRYSSDLLSLTKSGLSALLYQAKILNKDAVAAAKNMVEGLTKYYIKPENYFFILDDFERCTIPMQERLGVISILLEEYKAKVLIIGNESEICDDEKDVYKKNNEKVIGVTIPYQVPIKERIRSLLKNERYKRLSCYEKEIVDFCEEWEVKNLRHIEYAFDSFLHLNREIQSELNNLKAHKAEVERVLLINVFAVAMHHKNKKNKRGWNGDNLYEYTADYKDKEIYNTYAVIAFRFVESLIYDYYIDKKEVGLALSQYNSLLEHKDSQNDPINRLEKIFDMDETTAAKNLEELSANLQKGKYAYADYVSIIVLLQYFRKMEFQGVDIERIVKLMEDNLRDGKYSDKVIGIRAFWEDNLESEGRRALERLEKAYKIHVASKTSLCAKMNEILKRNEPVEQVEECLDKIYQSWQKGLLNDIDIESFSDYVLQQSSEGIRKLLFRVRSVYGAENISEFYSSDAEILENLSLRLKTVIESESDKIKKYNLKEFANSLDNIVSRLTTK